MSQLKINTGLTLKQYLHVLFLCRKEQTEESTSVFLTLFPALSKVDYLEMIPKLTPQEKEIFQSHYLGMKRQEPSK